MSQTSYKKQRLTQVLFGVLQKRLSYCFRKIILFQDEDLDTNEATLKHYDLECEGISTIEDILKKKIINEKMKAFYAIKTQHLNVPSKHQKKLMATDTHIYHKEKPQYKLGSVYKNRYSYQSEQSLIYFRPSIQPQENDRFFPDKLSSNKQMEQTSCYEESIGGIMSKLHEINRVGSPRSYHDSVSAYMSRNMSATDLYHNRSRGSKRMFIMEKLSNLEKNVSDLASIGEINHSKNNGFGIHHSSLHQQYQMETPKRSTRTVQRIPGGFTRISENVF